MARVEYGALVTAFHGAIGGTVFQGSSKGNIARNKGIQAVTLANRQEFAKRNIILCAQAWSQLTAAQRTDFNTFATTFPQYDKKTGLRQLVGYEIFLLWNLDRLARNLAIEGDIALVGSALCSISPTLVSAAGVLTVDLNDIAGDPDTGFAYFLTRPMRPGITNPGSRFRFIVSTGPSAGGIDITSEYVAALGTIPVAGDYLFVDVKPFGILDPLVWSRQRFSIIVS